jgi:hypothetical protein
MLWGAAVLIVLLMISIFLYVVITNHRGDAALQAVLDKIHRRGLASRYTPLVRKRFESFSAPGNGAPLYLAALEVLQSLREKRVSTEMLPLPYQDPDRMPSLGEPVNEKLAGDLRTFFDNASWPLFLEIMNQAGSQPYSLYPFMNDDTDGEKDSACFRLIYACRCIGTRCLHEQASGHSDKSIEVLFPALDLIRSFRENLDGSVWITRVGSFTHLVNYMEGALSRTRPEEPVLVRLQACLADEWVTLNPQPVMRECIALQYETASEHVDWPLAEQDYEQEVYYRHLDPDRFVTFSGCPRRSPPWGEGRGRTLACRLWTMVCPGAYRLRLAKGIEETIEWYDAWNLPAHELARKVAGRARHDCGPGIECQDDVWGGAADTCLRVMAELRVAATALQVEIFRIRNDRWPGKLADLEGPTLVDPYDGRPLKFKRTDAGCVVYSVGRNLRDNGGDCENEGTDDIRFRLLDPPRRNVKPAGASSTK